MNQHTMRGDIQEVIEDGINRILRSMVRQGQNEQAKLLVGITEEIKSKVAERLQIAFTIRRPRKR